MRDVTLVILNSLRIKCHIRRSLTYFAHSSTSSQRINTLPTEVIFT